MFQGQTIRLRRVERNKYELRTAVSIETGTISEIVESLGRKGQELQRGALEVAICKQRLRDMVGQEDPDLMDILDARPSYAPPMPADPIAPTIPAPRPEAPAAPVRPTKQRRLKELAPGEPAKAKRSPGGLSYLRMLKAQEAQEQAARVG